MTTEAIASPPNLLGTADELAAELGGDVSARVAATVLFAAHDARDLAECARQAEEERLLAEQHEQVEKLRHEADAVRKSGIARGIGLGLSGAATASGAIQALSPNVSDARASSLLSAHGGLGKVAEGAGQAIGALYDAKQKGLEADGAAAAHRAGESERKLDDIDRALDDAEALARTAIDFERSTKQTQAASDQATLFIRG